jgi:hypothetical protein
MISPLGMRGKGIGFADRPGGACGASPLGALGPSGDHGGPCGSRPSMNSEEPPGIGHMPHTGRSGPLGRLGVLQCKAWPGLPRSALPQCPIDLGVLMCPMGGPEGGGRRSGGRQEPHALSAGWRRSFAVSCQPRPRAFPTITRSRASRPPKKEGPHCAGQVQVAFSRE